MIFLPKVSVIMPVYNAERMLKASVESVLSQSYPFWELIIVDDGSTDTSQSIAKRYAESDTRIRVHRQTNRGPSSARNYAICLSRGEYIAFLDADDTWSKDRLRDLVHQLTERPNVGVLFSRVRFVDAKSLRKGVLTPHRDRLDTTTLLSENPICTTSNIMCRRDVFQRIGGFKPELSYAEDQDWLVRVSLDGSYEICGLNMEGVYYSSSPESLSSNLEEMRSGWRRMMEDAFATHPHKVTPVQRSASARFHRYLARRALRMRRPKDALKYICYSLSQDPLMLFSQPRRTGLMLLGTLMSLTKVKKLQELVAK